MIENGDRSRNCPLGIQPPLHTTRGVHPSRGYRCLDLTLSQTFCISGQGWNAAPGIHWGAASCGPQVNRNE